VSERTTKNKNKAVQKKCETGSPHYKHIDEAISDALLLSNLRKPAQTNTKTEEVKTKESKPDPVGKNTTQDRQKEQTNQMQNS
jgi:hypothetical protein